MSVQTQKREELRQKIMAVATRAFGREGFRGASMRKIASELGISAPTLYYYFRDKHDLVWAILSEGLDRFGCECVEALAEDRPPPEQIRRYVVRHVRHNYRHPDVVQMMDNFFTSVSHAPTDIYGGVATMARQVLSPEHADEFSRAVTAILRRISAIIREGQARGEFKVDNVELATAGVIILPDHVSRWIQPSPLLGVDDIAEQQSRLILRMLGYDGDPD